MPRAIIYPAARVKLADCDSGCGFRLIVYISSQGYQTSFYSTREPQRSANPRESRNPRSRPPITLKGKTR